MKNLYAQVALTFRLSLSSMARILKKTEEEVYQELTNGVAYDALHYLWNFNTSLESEEISQVKEKKARNFLNLLISAQKRHDKSNKQALLEMLLKEERAYFEVKTKVAKKVPLILDDVEKISRYRVKYGISQSAFEQDLGITPTWLCKNEMKITDPELRSQLDTINNYFQDKSSLYNKPRR